MLMILFDILFMLLMVKLLVTDSRDVGDPLNMIFFINRKH